MEDRIYNVYIEILKEELVPALGCTEPIALAYASAMARKVLGALPEKMDVYCSGNIIKNVKSVSVPNSGGLHGIEAAAVLGAVGGDPDSRLEVLQSVTDQDRALTRQLLEKKICTCHLQEGVSNLYIETRLFAGEHSASVTICEHHTNIIRIEKDGKVLMAKQQGTKQEGTKQQKAKQQETEQQKNEQESAGADPRMLLNVASILEFAQIVRLQDIEDTIGRQIELNMAIAREGIAHEYGTQVGRTLLQAYGDKSVGNRAKAMAAAGSDARMNGCPMPVVVNSGSGNQGITCSVPVIVYAEEWKKSKEDLYRALVVSNLVSIHQKKYIGSLSAFCDAVSAGCGAGAGIAWLYDKDYDLVCRTITNTIGNVSGVVCDGAKSSCAAKIASAVDAAIMGFTLASRSQSFQPGDGVVKKDVEDTIKGIGYIGREGMKDTDVKILHMMIDS